MDYFRLVEKKWTIRTIIFIINYNIFTSFLSFCSPLFLSPVFALLYFIWAVRDYSYIWPTKSSPTSNTVMLFILGDFFCSLLPFILSIIYHTFMPHCSGEATYKQLLKADVFGVWWCCTLGPISNFYTGLYCNPAMMVIYFTLYTSFSTYILYHLMIVDCKRKRLIALTAQFFIKIFIYPFRLSPFSFTSPASCKFYFATDIISAIGAIVNALHIPERWFPGKLDYFLNGHTLMHIAAFASIVVARNGFINDMIWMNEVGVCPNGVSSLQLLESVWSGRINIGM